MNYFLTKIFFEIFNENPIATKCTTDPTIAPITRLSRIIHTRKKTSNEGTDTIIAIIDPFRIISLIDKLEPCPLDNNKKFKKW